MKHLFGTRARLSVLGAVIAAGALALTACGSSSDGSGNGSSSSSSGSMSDMSTSSGPSSSSSSSAGTPTCSSGTLNAEGSTAQANAMTTWIKAYQQACSGATINYNPTGSGAGITSFNSGKVDFAGSDSALDPKKGEPASAAKACGSTALDLPMVVGPIAIAYKLKGVDKLTLTPDVIAKIFLGKITTWNDAAIKSINSGVNLPSTKISVIYRSDSSGTTQNFEKYLAATAPSVFTSTPDKDSSKAGFAGQGKSKSSGVAAAISSTEGAIGYDEYSYAVNGSLSTAAIDNGGGAVELSPNTASAAAGAAKVTGTGNDVTLSLDYATKTAGAYPIVLVTYEVVCSKYKDAAKGTFVKNFLSYTVNGGQATLKQQGYAPLPTELQTKVEASIAAIS